MVVLEYSLALLPGLALAAVLFLLLRKAHPLLHFALWEGCIAGLVRARFGLIPATLTHGLSIFLLTSGLL